MSDEAQKGYLEFDDEEEYRKAVKKYMLQCLFMEGSKVILFFLIFSYYDLTVPFLVALVALMLVRCNGGGLHLNHYTTCFLLSLFIIGSCMYCGMQVPMPKIVSAAVLLLCGAVGYWIGPVVSRNRPEPDEETIRQSKKRTVGILLIYCLLICVCPYSQYLNIGTWTVIIHTLQLLLAKFLKRRRAYAEVA